MVHFQKSVFFLCCDELVHIPQTKQTAAALLRRDRLTAMLKLESASSSLQAEFIVSQVAEKCC